MGKNDKEKKPTALDVVIPRGCLVLLNDYLRQLGGKTKVSVLAGGALQGAIADLLMEKDHLAPICDKPAHLVLPSEARQLRADVTRWERQEVQLHLPLSQMEAARETVREVLNGEVGVERSWRGGQLLLALSMAEESDAL